MAGEKQPDDLDIEDLALLVSVFLCCTTCGDDLTFCLPSQEFRKADRDQSGTVTIDEFLHFVDTVPEARSIFAYYDDVDDIEEGKEQGGRGGVDEDPDWADDMELECPLYVRSSQAEAAKHPEVGMWPLRLWRLQLALRMRISRR